MRRATILHGTDNGPDSNWQPWLKEILVSKGFDVFVPQLPECHRPDRDKYNDYLRQSGWDFSDNIIIGHSSGSTTLLSLLQSDWFPSIEAAVFVGIFVNNDYMESNPPEWFEPDQFNNLFPKEGFDFDKIKNRAAFRYVIHGDNDPYCDPKLAVKVASLLDARLQIVPEGKHLSIASGGITELPWAVDMLAADGLL